MWAFPQQIVPLSFQLHQELAEEYDGATEWGYRGLKTLCIEGNISASNLKNIANQKKPKKLDVDLPEDLDWINTEIIDGWAHLGGAESTAQVQPYKFTLFILKKVLETGAVTLVTGKVTDILYNTEGQATGVKYTTSTVTRTHTHHHNNHQPARFTGRSSQPQQTNKSSLHHPQNPTFNTNAQQQTHSYLHTSSVIPDNTSDADSTLSLKVTEDSPDWPDSVPVTPPLVNSFRNIHSSDFASSVASTSSISESSEHSNVSTDDDESILDESALSSEDSGSVLDLDLNQSDDLTTDSFSGILADELKSSSLPKKKDDTSHIASLEADQIVLTLGPWTSKILPSCPISGLRAHSITIQPTKPVSPFALFTEMRTGRTSYVSPEIYPRRDEVYVCGEGDTFADVPESTDDVEVLRDRCDELFKHVGDISPQLKNGRILKRQACYLPVVDMPSHSGPFIGSTNVDHLYLASGHSCWGINNAPATGLLMAEILLDGEATTASVDGLEPEFFFDAASQ